MQNKPKGKLLIIGGHEEKGLSDEMSQIEKLKKHEAHFAILGELIRSKQQCSIEVIATASSLANQMNNLYKRAFKNAGFNNVKILNIQNTAQARDPVLIDRIMLAHAVFFTGGVQKKLCSVFNGTEILKAIKKKYFEDKNFIVAGTSAGAMSLPETIITGGIIQEALLKGDLCTDKGFNLIQDIIVDTHFIKRGRFSRLANAVTHNSSCIGLGLGEDSALIISNGNEAECRGSGVARPMSGSSRSLGT